MMIPKQVVSLFLLMAVGAVLGQEEGGCNCVEVTQAHEKCVSDWRALDVIRQTLEQQVRDTEFQSNERCNSQIDQVRGEIQAQVDQARGEIEQVRNEGNARVELVRSESQAQLEQVQSEKQAQLEETQRNAAAELSQCQSEHKQLSAQFEEQGSTHRRLQESSQQLEETLASVKSEKSKLEKTLSDKDLALNKANKDKKSIERESDETKKTLEEMIAAKTIITIDWDLLNERIEELKAMAAEAMNDAATFVGEQLVFVQGKLIEFYQFVESEIYPSVKHTIETDVIPLARQSSKQAQDMFEEAYAPYRPTVNENVKLARQESEKFYKQNVEPSVKEYKIDVYVADAKKTVEEYATLAHNHLLEGVKTGTGVAYNFVKLEEGPDFAVEALRKLHADFALVTYYIECFFAFLVAYAVLKLLFGGKKKRKGKKRMTKKEWEEKQQKEAAKAKQQQPKKNIKNGHKNNKKNK